MTSAVVLGISSLLLGNETVLCQGFDTAQCFCLHVPTAIVGFTDPCPPQYPNTLFCLYVTGTYGPVVEGVTVGAALDPRTIEAGLAGFGSTTGTNLWLLVGVANASRPLPWLVVGELSANATYNSPQSHVPKEVEACQALAPLPVSELAPLWIDDDPAVCFETLHERYDLPVLTCPSVFPDDGNGCSGSAGAGVLGVITALMMRRRVGIPPER